MTEDQMATAELAGRTRQGDGSGFGIRMDPYRREPHAVSLAAVSVLQLLAFGSSSLARFGLPGTVQA
jgi:hypothetical protein